MTLHGIMLAFMNFMVLENMLQIAYQEVAGLSGIMMELQEPDIVIAPVLRLLSIPIINGESGHPGVIQYILQVIIEKWKQEPYIG